jgi:hypothetical protein
MAFYLYVEWALRESTGGWDFFAGQGNGRPGFTGEDEGGGTWLGR